MIKKEKHNILLLSMSTLPANPVLCHYFFRDSHAEYHYHGISQLEPITKHVIRMLAEKNETLDDIIVLCTEETGKECGIEKYTHVGFYKARVEKFLRGQSEEFEGFFPADEGEKGSDFLKPGIKDYLEEKLKQIDNLSADKLNNTAQEISNEEKETNYAAYINKKVYERYRKKHPGQSHDCVPKQYQPGYQIEELDLDEWKKGRTEEKGHTIPMIKIALEKNSMEQILNQICDTITALYQPGSKLFIDTQGGARNTVFFVNAVVNMLKIRNIYIEKTYSVQFNKNNAVNEILDETANNEVFYLVSGMDEFIHYGRVKQLQKYFQNKESDSAKTLLGAMETISEAIAICNPGLLKDGIETLKKRIEDYEDSHKDNDMLSIFLEDIKKDYGRLFTDTQPNDLMIAKWCMKKAFYQQALTFIESRFPQLYFQEKLVYCRDRDLRTRIQKRITPKWKQAENYLFDNYAYESGDTTARYDHQQTMESMFYDQIAERNLARDRYDSRYVLVKFYYKEIALEIMKKMTSAQRKKAIYSVLKIEKKRNDIIANLKRLQELLKDRTARDCAGCRTSLDRGTESLEAWKKRLADVFDSFYQYADAQKNCSEDIKNKISNIICIMSNPESSFWDETAQDGLLSDVLLREIKSIHERDLKEKISAEVKRCYEEICKEKKDEKGVFSHFQEWIACEKDTSYISDIQERYRYYVMEIQSLLNVEDKQKKAAESLKLLPERLEKDEIEKKIKELEEKISNPDDDSVKQIAESYLKIKELQEEINIKKDPNMDKSFMKSIDFLHRYFGISFPEIQNDSWYGYTELVQALQNDANLLQFRQDFALAAKSVKIRFSCEESGTLPKANFECAGFGYSSAARLNCNANLSEDREKSRKYVVLYTKLSRPEDMDRLDLLVRLHQALKKERNHNNHAVGENRLELKTVEKAIKAYFKLFEACTGTSCAEL